MIRTFLIGAAALALAACGDGGAAAEANNAASAEAAANLAEVMPNELAEDDQSDSNLSNAVEAAPASGPRTAQPAPKAAPRTAPRRPAAPKSTAPPTKTQTEPDPHAGHDMENMSHD